MIAQQKSKGRKPAHLPAALLPSTGTEWLADSKKERLQLLDANLADHELSLYASECLVERVSFAGATLHHAFLRDVRFIRCDLSNADLRRSKLKRVEFVDCRLTGLKAVESEWDETLIENCECSYSQFTDGKMPLSEFRGSSFAEADLRGVSLTDGTFERCNLSRIDLTRASLKNTDLRGAEIEGITLRSGDLAGAIVTPGQAIELARFFGLKVR